MRPNVQVHTLRESPKFPQGHGARNKSFFPRISFRYFFPLSGCPKTAIVCPPARATSTALFRCSLPISFDQASFLFTLTSFCKSQKHQHFLYAVHDFDKPLRVAFAAEDVTQWLIVVAPEAVVVLYYGAALYACRFVSAEEGLP